MTSSNGSRSAPLTLPEADLAPWLDQPLSKALVQWLSEQVDIYRRRIPALVVNNDLDKARTATGALNAYEEILMTLEPKARPIEPPDEEPFTDPATRFSVRRAPPPTVQQWQDTTLGRRP